MAKVSRKLLKQAEPLIQKIANQKKKNSTFAHYTSDDIEQEVWVMCLDALVRYNSKIGPLENFLNNHVSNRLKNLKRDKYFRPGYCASSSGMAKTRMNLINALPLEDAPDNSTAIGSSSSEPDPFQLLLAEDTHDYIVDRLPPNLKTHFYSMVGGNKIRKPIAESLRKVIKNILKEREQNG